MAPRSRLLARRRELGLSETHVAHRCKVHPETYGRWEAGTQSPRIYQHRALADVLKVPLTSEDVTDEEPHPLDWYLARDDEASVADSAEVAGTVLGMDRLRRDVIVGGAALTFGAALAPTQVFASARDVPSDLASVASEQLRGHKAVDAQLGGRALLDTVHAQYRILRRAADLDSRQRPQLLAVAVGVANFAGWLWQDAAGDLDTAWQWHARALEIAHQTGDPALIALALPGQAFLHADTGDAMTARDLADRALATGVDGPARRYILRDASRSYAVTHQWDRLAEVIDEQADLGDDDGDVDERWLWARPHAMTRGYVDAQRALARGLTPEAVELWPAVLASIPESARRNRGNYHARFAAALLACEGPDEAVAPAAEAVECLAAAPSARLRRALSDLRVSAEAHPAGAGELVEVLQGV